MKTVMFLSLCLFGTAAWGSDGCIYDGTLYPVGETVVINSATAVNDGDAVLIQCSFIIDADIALKTAKLPDVESRNYTWVAFRWGQ